jgi:transposase InsO family protein
MTDHRDAALPASAVALFRYRLVAEVETRVLAGADEAGAVTAVAAREHLDNRRALTRVSRRSLRRWVTAYRQRGMAGLEPAARRRIEGSLALPPELLAFLRSEKTSDPEASVPEVLRRARRRGIVAADLPIDRVSAWRACRRMGLPVQRRKKARDRDMRRYGFPHRMMMLLADGSYFRAGESRVKRVALSLFDDATRFGLGVLVGTAGESVELFLEPAYDVFARYGLPDACFLDGGPGFVADDTDRVFGQLGIHLVHGTAGHAEGRGKIERYHRTLDEQLLRTFPGNPLVDPDPGALTLRLAHWLETVYNHTPHEGLGGETPAERWHRDSRALELPDPDWLRAQFLLTVTRRVKTDNTLSFEGRAYEVPRGHAGEKLTVYRHLLEQDDDGHEKLSILHQGRRVTLHVVDPTRNAYARRATGRHESPAPSAGPPPKTHADLAYEDDFRTLVDPDGGYSTQEDPDDQDPHDR